MPVLLKEKSRRPTTQPKLKKPSETVRQILEATEVPGIPDFVNVPDRQRVAEPVVGFILLPYLLPAGCLAEVRSAMLAPDSHGEDLLPAPGTPLGIFRHDSSMIWIFRVHERKGRLDENRMHGSAAPHGGS